MQTIRLPKSEARDALLRRYQSRFQVNPKLDRKLVSYQANKKQRIYNWFSYREGFSAAMVEHLLTTLSPQPGRLLDPFAGAGTALFASSAMGWSATGYELLPVGKAIVDARYAAQMVDYERLRRAIDRAREDRWDDNDDPEFRFPHIPITQRAFSRRTESALAGFQAYSHSRVSDPFVRQLFLFACMCVLESASYTRKDGQYLRWDYRAKKREGATFDKGKVSRFRDAVLQKLDCIAHDIGHRDGESLFAAESRRGPIDFRLGSCLEILPQQQVGTFDFILTSPPYCNRYDYTRTYALELVFLGCDADEVKSLRQRMLSCTVENREKAAELSEIYASIGSARVFDHVDGVFRRQEALHEVLEILESYREAGSLNNANIPKMVRNYFYEMCFVIYELARVLAPGGTIAMVNDNVRYAGEEVPVDLLLCDFAQSFGLQIRHIWTLDRGKGNSSQQMGNHGRSELRKCVYVWQKSGDGR